MGYVLHRTCTDMEARNTHSDCSPARLAGWELGGDHTGRPTVEEVNSNGIQRVIDLQPHN